MADILAKELIYQTLNDRHGIVNQEKLNNAKVAIFSYLDPVTAIILSTVLLAEPMSISQWIGAILILGSLLVSELFKKNN